ncbi:MAG: hypothetical protein AB8G05_18305 [Oligoflexales bacterium]
MLKILNFYLFITILTLTTHISYATSKKDQDYSDTSFTSNNRDWAELTHKANEIFAKWLEKNVKTEAEAELAFETLLTTWDIVWHKLKREYSNLAKTLHSRTSEALFLHFVEYHESNSDWIGALKILKNMKRDTQEKKEEALRYLSFKLSEPDAYADNITLGCCLGCCSSWFFSPACCSLSQVPVCFHGCCFGGMIGCAITGVFYSLSTGWASAYALGQLGKNRVHSRNIGHLVRLVIQKNSNTGDRVFNFLDYDKIDRDLFAIISREENFTSILDQVKKLIQQPKLSKPLISILGDQDIVSHDREAVKHILSIFLVLRSHLIKIKT